MSVGATRGLRIIGRYEREAIVASLGRWGFFAVVLSLIPILLNAADALTRDDKHFHFEALFQRGELLLVSSAILGAALAELFVREVKPRFRNLRLFAGCWGALVLLAVSAWFADIAAGYRDGAHLDHHRIALGSLALFGLSLVAGVSCLVLAQLEEPPTEPPGVT